MSSNHEMSVNSVIKQADFIESVADALQYISYYHPKDFVDAMSQAYEREQSAAAKDAIAQILINSRMSAEGKRPLCQDTGIVTTFVKVGMGVQWDKTDMTIQEMVDEGVRRAYTNPDNPLRASIVSDPAGSRKNTKDNTPSVVHIDMVPGNHIEVAIAAKGGGSENKAKMVMLNPSDDIAAWVEKTLPTMGAGWCPPGMLGIGIGGTAEKAAVLAKEALMESVDIHELMARGAQTTEEKLRLDIFERANNLGIGAQGLGGLTTVLDVKIKSAPTHAASKPVVMIPNCAATRHVHFHLDGSGPAELTPPSLSDWPEITREVGDDVRRVNLDTVTQADIEQWQSGETILLSGKMLTGRDAAHKRIQSLIESGEGLPEGVDFTGKFIYYVGPVDPVGTEVVGPAGPTTATRMDKFTDLMLEKTGLMGMIGKAERGPATVESIKKHKAVYLMAVGGAAYLVSKAIKHSRVVAFADLGMEAIYEFDVQDMPVTVAVDSNGVNAHETGPAIWKVNIANAKA
ncbi:fumarate hydratase [Shewanella sp. SP2S2-4]|uniref:Fumarate hydratase class I n=2 Tax=Shewanella TaxID=22 RepID=A9KZM0_SHEB9|nr:MULTISPECIES: fumarate hydratase [Shewanella]ABS08087.1 hydro-lyase, Fe-S type, tartrate/fumarate subfamily, alpha subunit [Shewanella baltica OS185]ABX49122.1 hydro-lyase, Fe-S type, tartrate/fumarate subfamily, alpha subunit [Shewanella baltica OS195]ADT94151.1 hydro-lyase, Fe-S type, tartrate/fumarate subfamily, alpha subunit [Shewanella baltica OS678]AEG11686.1 hydro-lyase, Fe-S type, tartrate/fumarate subfamily, alpha subunit [Shewanella baltica BA175]AUD61979.1 fumarate hydratase [She